jgi:hypothetical protein
MMGVYWQSLLKIFNEWALEEYGQRDDINWLGIDGKSLKNTLNNPNNKQQNFIMFVSLFSQESGLVLHLKRIENKKGSEIDEGQAIIEDCPLQNKVGSSRFCVISLTHIGSIDLCVLCVFVVRSTPSLGEMYLRIHFTHQSWESHKVFNGDA